MAQGVTIVGLGPGNPAQITREAWKALEGADEVYLRTTQHPSVPSLPQGPRYESFDAAYERHAQYAGVYEEIAERVIDLARREQGVVYAVPGHPLVGETTVLKVLERAEAEGLPARVIAGVSLIEPILTALRLDPFDGLQVADAMILAHKHHPNLDPDVGALVVQVYGRDIAADLKLTLMNLYPDDHPVVVVRAAGTREEAVTRLPLHALDRQDDLDHLTSAYLPPLERPGSLATYQDVVAALRAPGGCPWDREQTHATLRTHLLEESYEVLSALDADDMADLQEELGDLLLQVFLHAQIATEDGDFKMVDSVQQVIEKLVRRHPHVFSDETVADSDEVLLHWEQIKRQERAARGESEETFRSLLAGVPLALPALSRALEVQRRVARVGFDWPDVGPVKAKVIEELGELEEAADDASRAAELGDLLFSLVNLARWYGLDPESILRETVERFGRRFAVIERHAAESGHNLEDMTLDEMDLLWEQAKESE
ncbi:MAG: nucleoside triphosphate pyrophosphohydrolase [Chloroflexi bacterium]|nr:nucleoside triphosphate pyrophosphohydrolase [Chloroflexota bacterium]